MTILIYEDQNGHIRVSSSKPIDKDDSNLFCQLAKFSANQIILVSNLNYIMLINSRESNLVVITRVRNYLLRFSFTILLIFW